MIYIAPTDCIADRPTDGLTTSILIEIDNFFNNDIIMSSLVTNLNGSTFNSTGNCKLGHDYRRVRRRCVLGFTQRDRQVMKLYTIHR